MEKKNAVCQLWLESERGWGTRPDGYSLHVDESYRSRYIDDYWAKMPDRAPDEYSRPTGKPYVCVVSEEVYNKLLEEKNLRFYQNNYPPEFC